MVGIRLAEAVESRELHPATVGMVVEKVCDKFKDN